MGLLKTRCPTNVSGLVISIGIGKPIKRMLGTRPSSNILKKLDKVVHPLRANFDASSSIAMVCMKIGIFAPRLHVLPRLILGRSTVTICGAMFEEREIRGNGHPGNYSR